MNDELKAIATSYREKYNHDSQDLKNLYLHYYNRNLKPVTEAIISAAAVNSLWVNGSFDPSSLTDQQIEAYTLAFPNMEINEIANYSGESLEGLLTAWKGKLFEVKVRDELNSGGSVGNLELVDGQAAVLADSPTQPGWDLAILDSNDNVIEEIQLKSTDLISYVENSAERYPDISILATSEVEGASSQSAEIITTNFSNKQIEDELSQAVVGSGIDSAWDLFLPSLPFIINLYSIQNGSITPEEGKRNMAATAATLGVGSIVAPLIDLGLGALADTLITGGLFFGIRLGFGLLFRADETRNKKDVDMDTEVIDNILNLSSVNARMIGVYYIKGI